MLTQSDIAPLVALALEEDIGSGDITAGLVSADEKAIATVITREPGVLCGTQFVDAIFDAVDSSLEVAWLKVDGDTLKANDTLFTVSGAARSILTAERAALNFLQMLSGTASYSAKLAALVKGTSARLLDTRKTIPGFRLAQKYAVTCGGCHNHRIGLDDAFLIKENHIAACGGIREAIETARANAPGKPVEIEVESLDELSEALNARADRVMLDNFSLDDMRQAVALNNAQAELEASGNVTEGDVVLDNTVNSYVRSQSRLVTTTGVRDLVVVETADAVMVADRHSVQDVKNIVTALKSSARSEADIHHRVFRPWGSYESLIVGEGFQVKRIVVNPGQRLSLQMHHHRAEHWVVVRGTAEVVNGDETMILTEDQSTYIPIGAKHRLSNPTQDPLELLEVQSGSYLGEDDIVRFEDIYGRSRD